MAGGPRLPRLDVGPLAVEKPQPGGDAFIALEEKLPGLGEDTTKMPGVAFVGGQPLAAVGRVVEARGGEQPREVVQAVAALLLAELDEAVAEEHAELGLALVDADRRCRRGVEITRKNGQLAKHPLGRGGKLPVGKV